MKVDTGSLLRGGDSQLEENKTNRSSQSNASGYPSNFSRANGSTMGRTG